METDKLDLAKHIVDCGIIAVFRADDTRNLIEASKAVADGGIKFIEITMTTPGALRLIEKATVTISKDVFVGAGTVLDAATVRLAVLAGARFIVSPGLEPEVVEACYSCNVMAIPGVMTPTEIMLACRLGVKLLKLYPSHPAGPWFIREMSGPFPSVQFVASGGCTLENIPEFISSGAAACCVLGNGIGGAEAYEKGEFNLIMREAEKLASAAAMGRKIRAS